MQSYHFGYGKIRVFYELLPIIGKSGYCRTINHTMVATKTDINHLSFHQLSIAIFWYRLQLSNCDDADLRRQDEGTSVSSSNRSDIRKTDSTSN